VTATPLVVVGAGGHGREVLDVVDARRASGDTRYEVVGMVADRADADLLVRRGVRHLGVVDELVAGPLPGVPAGTVLVVAIGDPVSRDALVRRLGAAGWAWADALVHPAASIGADVELGEGVVVSAGARVTTNVRIGDHAQLNVNAVVSHDCRVEAHATLSPGALVNGTVHLGTGAFLGTGAIVTPGRRVGDWAVVGAGAVVVRDVPERVTAIGVPATWT
jgi:sugar O-acyltransferase (sialic acid O-acetyltransferase NeuD family)